MMRRGTAQHTAHSTQHTAHRQASTHAAHSTQAGRHCRHCASTWDPTDHREDSAVAIAPDRVRDQVVVPRDCLVPGRSKGNGAG